MSINPTQLRTNLYKILDEVLETQKPVEILRHGQVLEISVKHAKHPIKLSNIKSHPGTICGDPNDLVSIDWTSSWKGDSDL